MACGLYLSKAGIKKEKQNAEERSVLHKASSAKLVKFELNLEGDQGRTMEKGVHG